MQCQESLKQLSNCLRTAETSVVQIVLNIDPSSKFILLHESANRKAILGPLVKT